MLEHTFVHVPGIGYTTEQRLWCAGICTWEDALKVQAPPGGFSQERWQLVQDTCRCSIQSLQVHNYQYFARHLQSKDHWRAWENFARKTAYLDIETDGGTFRNSITVIGLYDGLRVRQYVKGENLDDFVDAIEDFAFLVTFNGASFDIPILKRRYGDIFPQLHCDLRYALSKLGYSGGLKQIEKNLGIVRGGDIIGLAGDDAIYLWQSWLHGNESARELLLEYNAADIVNLEVLMQFAWTGLSGSYGILTS